MSCGRSYGDRPPTGLLLTEPRLGTLTRVSHYRAGSAGSAVAPDGVLSAPAPGAVLGATETARESGITVCLHVDYCSQLWTSGRARTALRPVLHHTDLLIASEDELPLVQDVPGAGESEAVHGGPAAGGI